MNHIKRLLKKLLPPSTMEKLKSRTDGIKFALYGFLIKVPFLQALYYAFFTDVFSREQRGVMYGIHTYAKGSWSDQKTEYTLRRNIHQIEKGLSMRPLRNVFGVAYITETVRLYEQSLTACPDVHSTGANELVWAHDVLEDYFSVVTSHPVLDQAKAQFERLPPFSAEEKRSPYPRGLPQPSPVSYEDMLCIAQLRRSVRWYLQQPVPRDLLDKAITVAALSPSACNRQPFEFRIFDDPKMVQEVGALPGGTGGFYQNFPVIIVLVGKLRAYFGEQDRHLIYIDGSLAAMSFMLALETMGLSSCGINWHDNTSNYGKMEKLLDLAPDEMIVMLISVGYPDPNGMVAYSQKKELDLLRRYN